MNILITGTAGFIGNSLANRLLEQGHSVYGIDSINDYYDVSLKLDRLRTSGIVHPEPGKATRSEKYEQYTFCQTDLCDTAALNELFASERFDCVVNLAAQAGVRYSLTHPESYIQSNIAGFANLLETCKRHHQEKIVYASSSSVFTVYGPWGRPDMAPMLFARSIQENKTIRVFNNGKLSRDFTYIDDIVTGIEKIVTTPGIRREDVPGVPATIYNIGHGSPVRLMDFIHELEKNMGKEARKEFVGMQAGDVYQTWADTSRLQADYGYTPGISLETGITRFIEWFKNYHHENTK